MSNWSGGGSAVIFEHQELVKMHRELTKWVKETQSRSVPEHILARRVQNLSAIRTVLHRVNAAGQRLKAEGLSEISVRIPADSLWIVEETLGQKF